MTHRALVLICMAAPLLADPAAEAWDLVSAAASALSQSNAVYFLSLCDSGAPAYQSLRTNVTALLDAADVQSSIDLLSNDGDDRRRTLEVDWLLRIVSRGGAARSVERRQQVKCILEKRGKKWRIVALEPAAFLAPAPVPAPAAATARER